MTAEPAVISRRLFLRAGLAGLAVVAVGTLSGCDLVPSYTPMDSFGRVDFRQPLPVPLLDEGLMQDGARRFELVAQAGKSSIVDAGSTMTWGINGSFLGPTLRVRRGDRVEMTVRNDLGEPTTLHWHGMHLPAAADGGPHQMVAPGGTWSPSWVVDQPAATLWYHPHPHGQTERHVYRGLAGMLIIDDDNESDLDLPRRYGEDDFPLIIQDKTFDKSGELLETHRYDNGMLGDTILVNGAVAPILTVTAERTRLRILNASTARSYDIGFSDDREFTMIGSDGGLLRAPVALTRLHLTPGERAEIIVLCVPGEELTLRSHPHPQGLPAAIAHATGASDRLDILLIRAATALAPSPLLPVELAVLPSFDPPAESAWRRFELRNFRINGADMDPTRIDVTVEVDTIELWEVRNAHDKPHNFHIHDVQFQIRNIDGQAPPAHLAGWKDTVYLPPRALLQLLMRFSDHTDRNMPYMYHCHLLWHEDNGMMGQFVVVDPGETAGTPPPIRNSGHGGH